MYVTFNVTLQLDTSCKLYLNDFIIKRLSHQMSIFNRWGLKNDYSISFLNLTLMKIYKEII